MCALVVVRLRWRRQQRTPGKNIPGVVIERAPGRSHRQGPIDYPGKKPPSGGDHNPVPLTCGYYDQQPPDEYAVHSLEHGAVWVAYSPDTSPPMSPCCKQLAKHDQGARDARTRGSTRRSCSWPGSTGSRFRR